MKHIVTLITLIYLPSLMMAQFWEAHWITENTQFSGSGGETLTVIQTECEEGFVQVTDSVNTPLPSFSPIIINPQDSSGTDITDISSFDFSLTMRARSKEAVTVSALFRSDDGSSDFRTNLVSANIPAGLGGWT